MGLWAGGERRLRASLRDAPWFLKSSVFFHSVIFSLWSSVASVLLFSLCMLGVLYWQRFRGRGPRPLPIVVITAVTALLALSSHEPDELLRGLNFTVRMLGVMVGTAVFGAVIDTVDCIQFCRAVRAPVVAQDLVIGVYTCLQIAPRLAGDVFSAQRGRGLFRARAVCRGETLLAVAIPYMVGVMRSTQMIWVSLNIRPAEVVCIQPRDVRFLHVIMVVALALLWWV